MEIKIQSTLFIKPSKSTPQNLRYFNLSLLDQLAPWSYINQIYYYKPNGAVNTSDRFDHLVKSLSDVLTLYYPLAGRITQDGLMVDCRDQGVKYLETRVSSRLDEFFEQGPVIDHVRQLICPPDQVLTTLVAVQVNLFDCGAVVIGVSGSHKVTDAFNLVRFVNKWASLNRTGCDHGAFCPSFDNLDSLFPPKKISTTLEKTTILDKQQDKIVTKRYVFNGASISNLREKVGLTLSSREHSRVTLVSSLIWKALISIDQIKSGSLRNCLLAPAINFRKKTGSLTSESSFGNVWAPYPIRFSRNETEPTFTDLVALIEDTTKKIITQIPRTSCKEICMQAISCYAEVEVELRQNKFCIITSWCNFPIYEADFGWGTPCWASEAGRSHEMVTLVDDKHGDGVEAWVNLNEKDMYLFEKDQDILTFSSYVV